MDITATIIPTIIDYTLVPVGRQVGYLIHYKSNLQNLGNQLENLDVAKDRIKQDVDEVERRGKGVHTDVRKWQREADEISQEARTILEDVRKGTTKCLHGICPNPISYHQLSRKSKKLVTKIELHEKIKFPIVSFNTPVKEACALPSEEYMAFESRISLVKSIMQEFKNPKINMIGVYGFGGVGKTTFAKEVFRKATDEQLFDEVVIILNVKEKQDLEKIQKEVAEKLGMDVNESETMEARANCLWNRIKEKKTLVILDDLLRRIDLEAVGLHCGRTCNLLLTSRDKKVLKSEMRAHKTFPLKLLNEEETWSLFEKLSEVQVKDERIWKVASQVSKKCGGLPVLVVAVASTLKGSTFEEWKDALRIFKNFDKKELTETAFLALEWSFNQLEVEELKPFFLLCATEAQGRYSISLSDLLKYTKGLGLVKSVLTVEDARCAMHTMIKKLQDSGLLLDGNDDAPIRMHDLVRDVAVRILSRDQHILAIPRGNELKEWPNKDHFKRCSKISLPYCTIPKLPEVPWECPELKMLYIGTADKSLKLPDNFFEKMKELKVLDLTRFHLPSLPPSLELLENLQTLCLDQCVLGNLDLVGQLTNLKILSLAESKFKELPREIKQLTGLQLLDLTGCSELVQISPNIISSLTRLEDLRIGRNSFKQWDSEGASNASVLELKQLSQLTALEIHIPDAKILPPNLFSDKIERFTILIGDCWQDHDIKQTTSNILKLKLTTRDQFDQSIQSLLKRCQNLSLDGMEGANIFSYLLENDGIKQLKHLHLRNQATIDTEAEEITLDNKIGGPTKHFMTGEVFMPNLTSLVVHQFDGLRFMFSCAIAKSLVQLEHLEISECQHMEEIVSKDDSSQENTDNMFCKLKHLRLQHLPSLTRFCSGSCIDQFPSLELLHLEDCSKLGTFIIDSNSENVMMGKETEDGDMKGDHGIDVKYFLFDEKVGFPSLKTIVISDQPKLRTIWHHQLAEKSFCNLINVSVFNCQSLMNIFGPSMMGRLNSLYDLTIKQCKSLQVVFEVGATPLKSLECPNLDLVAIDSCESLKNIFPASVAKDLHQLRCLKVENCAILEEIVANEEGREITHMFVFPKLTDMIFKKLPRLSSFYSGLYISKWPLLNYLGFLYCYNVEILCSEFSRFQTNVDELGVRRKQPFLIIDKGTPFPNLKKLVLSKNTEIWYEAYGGGPLPAHLFSKLKLIQFSGANPKSFAFLQKLHNLEKLIFWCSPWKQIFVYDNEGSDRGGEIHAVGVGTLPDVKHLSFRTMPELMHLGMENSPQAAGPVFPNVEILEVYTCGRLKNNILSSSLVSFHNLIALDVRNCHGLEYITTYSVAKYLYQLKEFRVWNCGSMKEIVANDGGDYDDSGYYEIVFSQLQRLKLSNLPSLQGFCSGNCIVKVPSLETLIVKDCPVELKKSPNGLLLLSETGPERLQIADEEGNETQAC